MKFIHELKGVEAFANKSPHLLTEKETATGFLKQIFDKYYNKKCPTRTANDFIIKVSGVCVCVCVCVYTLSGVFHSSNERK